MWRKVALTIVALMAVTLSTAQTYDGYNIYQNGRFGFYMRYPSYLEIGSLSNNGDGATFYSKDKSIMLKATGIFNLLEYNIHDLMSSNAYSLLSDGCSITYSHIDNNSFILSGYTRSGKIYYLKETVCTMYSPAYEEYVDIIASAYLEHSPKDKAKGDDIIKQFKRFPFKP